MLTETFSEILLKNVLAYVYAKDSAKLLLISVGFIWYYKNIVHLSDLQESVHVKRGCILPNTLRERKTSFNTFLTIVFNGND